MATRERPENRWTEVVQVYRLPAGPWLELVQMVTARPDAGSGWGQARYAPEVQAAPVGQTTGYMAERFGWQLLDWKVGAVGYELRAPVGALSRQELLNLAGTVQ